MPESASVVLLVIALATAAAAAWKARGAPALAALFGVTAAAFCAVAAVCGRPFLACVLLHGAAITVAKTCALARAPRGSVSFGRGAAYLFLWPSLDPRRAFVPAPGGDRLRGLSGAATGVLETYCAFQVSTTASRLGVLAAGGWPAAWVRALSLFFLLDGVFRAADGCCRSAGFDPEPSFDRPWRAKDLGEFWGRRWNAFIGRTLFHEVFRPWSRRAGPATAALLAFAASGVLHEVLYGLPTGGPTGRWLTFFAVQWAGVVVSSRIPSPAARRVLLWATLLASAPLFFGGTYPTALPLEDVLR